MNLRESTDPPNISFEIGRVDDAIDVMREAARWLNEIGMPLWMPDDLSKERLLKEYKQNQFIHLKADDSSVGAMLLKWEDRLFWPEARPGESGYIHKLCIRRAFSSKGYSQLLIRYAVDQCRKRNARYLRLDCAADREKLCSFYESMSFVKVNRRMMGSFDIAFYELPIF